MRPPRAVTSERDLLPEPDLAAEIAAGAHAVLRVALLRSAERPEWSPGMCVSYAVGRIHERARSLASLSEHADSTDILWAAIERAEQERSDG